jgi:hypothetical protein
VWRALFQCGAEKPVETWVVIPVMRKVTSLLRERPVGLRRDLPHRGGEIGCGP